MITKSSRIRRNEYVAWMKRIRNAYKVFVSALGGLPPQCISHFGHLCVFLLHVHTTNILFSDREGFMAVIL
jgi:hypothetical protein